jgi:hypothetical protein
MIQDVTQDMRRGKILSVCTCSEQKSEQKNVTPETTHPTPKTSWPIFLCLCLFVLAGCNHNALSKNSPTPGDIATGVASLTFFNFPHTGKLAHDHIVSWFTGRNCSTLSLEQTGVWCPETIELVEDDVYCYRTLAGVDCHRHPDPYRNGHRALKSPPPQRRIEQDIWLR